MSKDFDPEKKIYEIYAKLKKEDLFNDWTSHGNKVMIYLEREWGYENPPTENEIAEVINQFSSDEGVKKVFKVLNKNDKQFLLDFMRIGFNEIINGSAEKEV